MTDVSPVPPDTDALIERYATDRTHPLLRVNFVSSLDGAAEIDGRSGKLGTDADHRVFGILRMLADGLMVGAGTLRHEHYRAVRPDDAGRAWRAAAGLPPYPRLVVVSGRLDLDPAQAAFADAPVRPVVITHGGADDDRLDALAAVADVRVHGVDRVDLRSAVTELRQRYGMGQLMCEGGPHLFGALHAADLVDEVCLTVSPLAAGPGAGRIIAGPAGPVRPMRLVHALVEDGTLLLRYARGS
jgi:riboflavin biosynthesis pyrimidine reductase